MTDHDPNTARTPEQFDPRTGRAHRSDLAPPPPPPVPGHRPDGTPAAAPDGLPQGAHGVPDEARFRNGDGLPSGGGLQAEHGRHAADGAPSAVAGAAEAAGPPPDHQPYAAPGTPAAPQQEPGYHGAFPPAAGQGGSPAPPAAAPGSGAGPGVGAGAGGAYGAGDAYGTGDAYGAGGARGAGGAYATGDPRGLDEAPGTDGAYGMAGAPGVGEETGYGAGGGRGVGGAADREPLLGTDAREKANARLERTVHGFVDRPRQAVEEADALFAQLAERLPAVLEERRRSLRREWTEDGCDTEHLRVALRDYRVLTERLLTM